MTIAVGEATKNNQAISSDQQGIMNNEFITGLDDGGLSLPSEHLPPSWLKEGAMNLGVNLYPQEQ